jgi:hypothetical protein
VDLLVLLDHLLVACGGHCCHCSGVEGAWYYLRWKVEDEGVHVQIGLSDYEELGWNGWVYTWVFGLEGGVLMFFSVRVGLG